MAEAAVQLQKGLGQLAMLPDGPERQRQELEFCNTLGEVLVAVKGHAAPERDRRVPAPDSCGSSLVHHWISLQIPFGQSMYHMYRGELLDLALRLDEHLLRLSRQQNDSAGLALGHLSCGRTLMVAGRLTLSRSHLEEARALYDPISHHSLVHHLQVTSQAMSGIVQFCLGYPDQARTRISAAIAEARRLAQPPALAVGSAFGARLHSLDGDDAALNERAEQLVAVATEQCFPYWRALGTIYRGWVKVRSGDVAEGISFLRAGSTAYRATGAEVYTPHFIALLAQACEIAG
jgi:hypothetical protein